MFAACKAKPGGGIHQRVDVPLQLHNTGIRKLTAGREFAFRRNLPDLHSNVVKKIAPGPCI